MLGTAIAVFQLHQINWLTLAISLFAVALVHGASNVLNDYYDDLSGADRINTEPLTPFAGGSRVIQQQLLTSTEMFRLGWTMLSIAILLGLWLAVLTGPLLLMIGIPGLILALIYSAPPFALAYRGFGEIVIIAAFGILPVLGSYFVQTGTVNLLPLWVGIISGLLTAAILFVNQFPDYVSDGLCGKKTTVVRLGPQFAARLYPMWFAAAALLLAALIISAELPALMACALMPLPLVWKNTRDLCIDHNTHQGLLPVIKRTIVTHAMVTCLMIITLLISAFQVIE